MTTNLRIPDELALQLADLAGMHQRSFHAEVVYALEQYVLRQTTPAKEEDSLFLESEDEMVIEEQRMVIIEKTITQRHLRDDTPYDLYSFVRVRPDGAELGYVGKTSVGYEQRIKNWMNKLKYLEDPFLQWLYEGKKDGTLRYGKISSVIGYHRAKSEEQKYIKELKPVFNQQHNTLRGVPEVANPLALLRLEGPE